MKIINTFLSSISNKFIKKKGSLVLDFGSGNARFYLNGNLIESVPSFGSILQEKRFQKMRLVDRGTIVNSLQAENFLNKIIKTLINQKAIWPRFDGYYLASSDTSKVEKLIIKKVISSLDHGSWNIISKKDVVETPQGGVIDIGFDLTEVILGVETGSIVAKTIKSGSRAFTSVIRRVIRDKYQLDVSWAGADKIKKEISGNNFLLSTSVNKQKITVRGKDIYSFVPKTIVVDVSVLQLPLLEKVEELFDEIKLFFSSVSTNTLMNSIEQGIDLWGDGGKLAGLEGFLSQKLQTSVKKGKVSYEVHR